VTPLEESQCVPMLAVVEVSPKAGSFCLIWYSTQSSKELIWGTGFFLRSHENGVSFGSPHRLHSSHFCVSQDFPISEAALDKEDALVNIPEPSLKSLLMVI